MIIFTTKPVFVLGQIVITSNALKSLTQVEIEEALKRHAAGDWGEVCEDDHQQNDLSLEHGCRLFSAYGTAAHRFWIITEADRSATTILMPEDY